MADALERQVERVAAGLEFETRPMRYYRAERHTLYPSPNLFPSPSLFGGRVVVEGVLGHARFGQPFDLSTENRGGYLATADPYLQEELDRLVGDGVLEAAEGLP